MLPAIELLFSFVNNQPRKDKRPSSKEEDMIVIHTRCAILLVIVSTVFFVFSVVCFASHFMDRSSAGWSGGFGLPMLHGGHRRHFSRVHSPHKHRQGEDTIECGYNNTLTLFIISDEINVERRYSLRKVFKFNRNVRSYCVRYMFLIYGDVPEAESSDGAKIDKFNKGFRKERDIDFSNDYRNSKGPRNRLKDILQPTISSESSSEETNEDISKDTSEETAEEDDTVKKNRTTNISNIQIGRDIQATSQPSQEIRQVLQGKNNVEDITRGHDTDDQDVPALLRELSTSRDIGTQPPTPQNPPQGIEEHGNAKEETTHDQAKFSEHVVSKYKLRADRDSKERSADPAPGPSPHITEEATAGVLSRQQESRGDNENEKPAMWTECEGGVCRPVVSPDGDEVIENEAKEGRYNSMIVVKKLADTRTLEEMSSQSRWKIFMTDTDPPYLGSLARHVSNEAKNLPKNDPCCQSLDQCSGCKSIANDAVDMENYKLNAIRSAVDMYILEDDVRKVLWNNANDVVIEYHVEPRNGTYIKYWNVFNM